MTDFSDINSEDYKDETPPSFDDTSVTYLQFLEAHGAKNVDPLSPEGLALQAQYLKELAEDNHPLDVLRKISLNPFSSARDRISAASKIMEYTMIKAPSKVEVTGAGGGALKLDHSQLAALSNEELDTLMTLLNKANSKD